MTKKSLQEATIKEASTPVDDLKGYLQTQVTKWRHILNSHYKTDGGHSLEEYAKGCLESYIDTLSFLEKLNDK